MASLWPYVCHRRGFVWPVLPLTHWQLAESISHVCPDLYIFSVARLHINIGTDSDSKSGIEIVQFSQFNTFNRFWHVSNGKIVNYKLTLIKFMLNVCTFNLHEPNCRSHSERCIEKSIIKSSVFTVGRQCCHPVSANAKSAIDRLEPSLDARWK